MHKLLSFRQRNDLNKCKSDIQVLTIKVTNETEETIITTYIQRPPRANEEIFKNEDKTVIEASKGGNKQFYLLVT